MKLHVELDTGEQSSRAYKSRFNQYRTCKDYVIWVCHSERRMRNMMERASVMAHCAMFTVLGSDVWHDAYGGSYKAEEMGVGFSRLAVNVSEDSKEVEATCASPTT